MPLKKEIKSKVISDYKTHATDTGSPEVQIAVLTSRMEQLVEHLKKHKKDQHSRRGLLLIVGQRKRMLQYLEKTDAKRYEELTASLKLK